MTTKTDNVLAQVASKVMSWVLPALAGALLTLLLNSGGDRRQIEVNTQAIHQLQEDTKALQQNYATNKRVDDLQVEVRSNYRDLSTKLDNVLQLLIERKR